MLVLEVDISTGVVGEGVVLRVRLVVMESSPEIPPEPGEEVAAAKPDRKVLEVGRNP